MGGAAPTNCRFEKGGNAEVILRPATAVRIRIPSGARGFAVAYADAGAR